MFGGEGRIDGLQIHPDHPPGQALQRAQRLLRRHVGGQARDVRMVNVEQVQQQQVGAWLAASSALVTLLSSG